MSLSISFFSLIVVSAVENSQSNSQNLDIDSQLSIARDSFVASVFFAKSTLLRVSLDLENARQRVFRDDVIT